MSERKDDYMQEDYSIKQSLQNFSLKNLNTRIIAYLALFMAFTVIATFIRVPGVNTQYYNLGEVAIYTLALVFGRKVGFIAGGIGSALADLMIAPIWAPITLIVKGFEGWVVGSLAESGSFKRNIIALFLGAHIMIIGYFLAVWGLYDWPAAISEIIGNYGQALVGGIVAIPLSRQVNKYLGSD
ncbi:MAG: ECF transporter S component [Halanaerobiales bacterium]